MKKRRFYSCIVLLSILSVICFAGCKKEDVQGPHEGVIILSDSSMSISGGEGKYSIQVVTNSPLKITTNADWITFPDSAWGKKEGFNFPITVSMNSGKEVRVGIVSFVTQGGDSVELKVVQKTASRKNIYVKENGNAGNKGYDWADATTLGYALSHAINGATIHVAAGNYIPTQTISGGDSTDAGDNTFYINKDITIIGGFPKDVSDEATRPDPEKYATVLSGNNKSYHTISIGAPVSAKGEIVILKGLTITQGNGNSGSGHLTTSDGIEFYRTEGGGIIIAGSADVELDSCKIIKNESHNGAGIYATQTSTLTMKHCEVNDNTAESHAGGMYVRTDSKLYIYDSEINSNESTGSICGGVYLYDGAQAYIYNSVITGNHCHSHGGGLYLRDKSVCNLVNVMISDNVSNTTGGGIFVYDNSNLNMVSSTVVNNSTNNKATGGGIYLQKGKNVAVIINSIVSGNKEKGSTLQIVLDGTANPAPVLKSSVVGTAVYDKNGSQISGVNFSYTQMMKDMGNGLFIPTGDDNPAMKYGLAGTDLVPIAKGLTPSLTKEVIISEDLDHNARKNTVMGAVIQ